MSNKLLAKNLFNTDTVIANSVRIIDLLFPPPRPIALRFWEGTTLPAEAGACLVLNHPSALRRMLTPPIERSLAEAFIRGDFDVEGDIFAVFPSLEAFGSVSFSLFDFARLLNQVRALPQAQSEDREGRRPTRLRGQAHSRQRDRKAVQLSRAS